MYHLFYNMYNYPRHCEGLLNYSSKIANLIESNKIINFLHHYVDKGVE